MRPYLCLCTALSLGLSCRAPGHTSSPDAAPSQKPAVDAPPSEREILDNSNLPITQATPLVDDESQTTVHRLSNGMTVYLSPSYDEPTFDAWISVRTGSRNDPADSTGLAHYLEHMLFKGSDKLGTTDFTKEKAHIEAVARLYDDLRKSKDPKKRQAIFQKIDQETQAMAKYSIPNEFDRLYKSLGAQGINAFTSVDQTVYLGTYPKNRLAAWAEIESDRFKHPQFRLFFPELEAVYEEKNRSMDNPHTRAYEALNAALFPTHPYGTQQTIGTIEHLKTPAYGDMVRYFHRWYQPNNMAIALAGNFDRREALELLEKRFSSWRPQALQAPTPANIEPLKTRSLTKVQGPGQPGAMLGWVTVPAGHKDATALEVMDALVMHEGAGLLNEKLVLTQILPSAGSMSSLFHEGGAWLLMGSASQGQSPEQVEAQLLSVVESIRKGEFSDDQLAAVKLNLEISRKRSFESNRQRVQAMTESFILRRPWQDYADYAKKISAISRDDVLRVANRYLGPNYAAIHQIRGRHQTPNIDKPKITPVKIDSSRSSAYARQVSQIPADPIEARWLVAGKDFAVLGGKSPGYSVVNPRNDLFDLSITYPVGNRSLPRLCHAMSLAQKSGSQKQSAAEIQKGLYAVGSRVSLGCGQEESRIHIEGIDRNLEKTLELVSQWLEKIKITDEDVQRYASGQLASRRAQIDNPNYLSHALLSYSMRGKDSPYKKSLSNKELLSLRGSSLSAELAKLLQSKYELSYYGPRSKGELEKLALLGKPRKSAPKRRKITYPVAKQSEILLIDQPNAQAIIRIYWPSKPTDTKGRVMAKLANNYLGGMGGLLFQEVREARGLAYSVAAQARQGAYKEDDGVLHAMVGTQADKSPEALSVLLAQLKRPIDEKRLAASKKALIQAYRNDHVKARDRIGVLRAWARAGHKEDPRAEELALVESIDAKTLGEYLQSFTKVPAKITLVGPKARVQLDKLKAFGTIQELRAKDVFNYGEFADAKSKASRR